MPNGFAKFTNLLSESFDIKTSLTAANQRPAGEGAGYAGGIMSARVDGVRIAQRICEIYKPFD